MSARSVRVTGRLLAGTVILALVFLMPPLAAEAAEILADCGRGDTIRDALAKLKPGDTLFVRGTCEEHVVISYAEGITLDGQGAAVINGPDSSLNTVEMLGVRNVKFRGFRITGGRDGIVINAGQLVALEVNIVERVGRHGIHVQRGTTMAHVVHSTIQDNPQHGIVVNENSYLRIGFGTGVGASEGDAGPNVIQRNGGHGIHVQRASMSRIYVSYIRNNRQNGVNVEKLSFVEIAANIIEGNTRNGVQATQNSGVHLGTDTGTGNENRPNNTETPNGQYGIDCSLGAYAEGRLGPLTGKAGQKNFTSGANDSLLP